MTKKILPYAKLGASLLLNPLGKKIVSSERPTRTFSEFFSHITKRGFEPATVLDVGAASGTLSLHEAFPNAHFILVEALSEFQPTLIKLAENYSCEIHMTAVGDRNGSASLALHEDPYGTFISDLGNDARTNGVRNVQLTRLEDILNESNPPNPILAKFDIQGYELEAISGMGNWLQKIDIFIIETSIHIVSTYPPDLATVVVFMKQNGYSVFDILDGLVRPYDGDLSQIDLVFVKDDGVFRRAAGRWS